MFLRDDEHRRAALQLQCFHRFRIATFYFFFLFIIIRIWIFVVAANSIPVFAVSSISTFMAFLFWFRWRQRRIEAERNLEILQVNERRNADIILMFHSHAMRGEFANNVPVFSGLNQNVINSLSTFTYCEMEKKLTTNTETSCEPDSPVGPFRQFGKSSVGTSCAICLSEYIHTDLLMLLPCVHSFHKVCVEEWFNCHDTCPLCKAQVVVSTSFVDVTDDPVRLELNSTAVESNTGPISAENSIWHERVHSTTRLGPSLQVYHILIPARSNASDVEQGHVVSQNHEGGSSV